MIGGGFFRGTSHEQDSRFANKQNKLKKTMKFPPEYDAVIDLKKVNLTPIVPWVQRRLTELLGFEDEVVASLVTNILEKRDEKPDPRDLQITLTGFLAKRAKDFVLELWKLLISATQNEHGIPSAFVTETMRELANRKAQIEQGTSAIRQAAGQAEAKASHTIYVPPPTTIATSAVAASSAEITAALKVSSQPTASRFSTSSAGRAGASSSDVSHDVQAAIAAFSSKRKRSPSPKRAKEAPPGDSVKTEETSHSSSEKRPERRSPRDRSPRDRDRERDHRRRGFDRHQRDRSRSRERSRRSPDRHSRHSRSYRSKDSGRHRHRRSRSRSRSHSRSRKSSKSPQESKQQPKTTDTSKSKKEEAPSSSSSSSSSSAKAAKTSSTASPAKNRDRSRSSSRSSSPIHSVSSASASPERAPKAKGGDTAASSSASSSSSAAAADTDKAKKNALLKERYEQELRAKVARSRSQKKNEEAATTTAPPSPPSTPS